jgi:hypothetical protein
MRLFANLALLASYAQSVCLIKTVSLEHGISISDNWLNHPQTAHAPHEYVAVARDLRYHLHSRFLRKICFDEDTSVGGVFEYLAWFDSGDKTHRNVLYDPRGPRSVIEVFTTDSSTTVTRLWTNPILYYTLEDYSLSNLAAVLNEHASSKGHRLVPAASLQSLRGSGRRNGLVLFLEITRGVEKQ